MQSGALVTRTENQTKTSKNKRQQNCIDKLEKNQKKAKKSSEKENANHVLLEKKIELETEISRLKELIKKRDQRSRAKKADVGDAQNDEMMIQERVDRGDMFLVKVPTTTKEDTFTKVRRPN